MAPADLVIANSTSNNVTVLLGNGDGTFYGSARARPTPWDASPSAVVVADFNGDGNCDFAVANRGITPFPSSKATERADSRSSPLPLSRCKTLPALPKRAQSRWPQPISGIPSLSNNNNSTGAPEVDLAVVNQTTNNVTLLLGSVDNNANTSFHRSDKLARSQWVKLPSPLPRAI